jgi:cobalt/nickel transport system permease protein
MTLALSLPPATDSPLGRLDPRWRLAALVVAAGASAAVRTLAAAGAALAGAWLLALLARLPLRWYLNRLAAVGGVLLLFAGPLPFLLEGPGPSWQWGRLHLSAYGLTAAGTLVAKALAVITILLVVLAAGPLEATLKAARALHVPGILVQIALLSYRYVFVLVDELRRLRIAMRVRGYRNRPTLHSYRTLSHVTGSLLVRGHERAERVSQAMRCRGFDGRFRTLTTFHTRLVDVLVSAAILASAAGLLCGDWLLLGG